MRIALSGPTDVVLVGMNQPQYVTQLSSFDHTLKINPKEMEQMFNSKFLPQMEFVTLYAEDVLEGHNISKKQPDTQWDY